MANSISRMKELINKIKEADVAYFRDDEPLISDAEYDALVAELQKLEEESGISFAGSPTKAVPGENKKGLDTVKHTRPMLSVKKTKLMDDVATFAGDRDTVVSWKLDGLTLVLRYEHGKLQQAITRGSDGVIGEDVTHTVKHFRNIPQRISSMRSIEVRGEGIVSWSDYHLLCRKEVEVAHPRSIAAGAARAITADKGKCSKLDFFAFDLITDEDTFKTKTEHLEYLEALGFPVVPHKTVKGGADALEEIVKAFDPDVYAYPVDGIVIEYDDLEYGRTLGATAHHDNCRIALKWADEMYQTVFRGVELMTTRTGAVSIVAEFDPVMIDGSYVKRADLHNLGNFESYKFGVGDTINVYKANMIIPQIFENLTQSGTYKLPEFCPCCGEKLVVRVSAGGVKELFCPNENCIARNAQKIARFCDKSAMNIEGLSAVTLEKMMEYGWVTNYADLYHIENHREAICCSRGFGVASYEALKAAIERSRRCSLTQFLVAVGIPLMGSQAARILSTYYYGSWDLFEEAIKNEFNFSHIEGISLSLERNIYDWYNNASEEKLWRPVLKELSFAKKDGSREREGKHKTSAICDCNIVITGTISGVTRGKMKEILTMMGARVTDSVTKNTDMLIVGSNPGDKKLGAALANGVEIVTESEFAEMLQFD